MKSFDPTPRKLKKAREDGDVAKSRELTLFISGLVGLLGIMVASSYILELVVSIRNIWEVAFLQEELDSEQLVDFSSVVFTSLIPLMLFLGMVFFAIILGEYLQVGFHVSFKSFKFDLGRLSFAKGVKKVFCPSTEGVLPEFVYSAAKYFAMICILGVLLLGLGGVLVLDSNLFLLSSLSIGDIFIPAILAGFVGGSLCLSPVVLFDRLRAIQIRTKRLRMDISELKQEVRDTEVSSELKQVREESYRQMLDSAILVGIKKAKVVLVGN